MTELGEFFYMGGRGQYVWSAYAAWLLIIVGVIVFSLHRGRRIRRELSTRYRLENIESNSLQDKLSEESR